MAFVREVCRLYPGHFAEHDTVEDVPVPPGWRALVLATLGDLVEVLGPQPIDRVAILRVERKAGGLRMACEIHPHPGEGAAVAAVVGAIVAAAERRSFAVCDCCGAPGALRRGLDGSRTTRCETHALVGTSEPPPRTGPMACIPEFDGAGSSSARMGGFTHWACGRFPAEIHDESDHDEVPPGWRRLCGDLLADAAAMMAGARDRRLGVRRLWAEGGGLRWDVAMPRSVPDVVRRGIDTAFLRVAEAASWTCRACGRGRDASPYAPPVCPCGVALGADLPEEGPTPVVRLPRLPLDVPAGRSTPGRPVRGRRSASPTQGRAAAATRVALYRRADVAAALGAATLGHEGPDLEVLDGSEDADQRETEQRDRLWSLLRRGDDARWRTLKAPTARAIATIEALSGSAPHLCEAVEHVARHLRAARTIGLPASLPPTLIVGPPGIGKSWLMQRIAAAIEVPFRMYPMNIATMSDGLGGSHGTWRNAGPGIVAKALLSEGCANLIVLLDEFDKAASHGGADAYRALYSLLEPTNARAFVDEYLGFPIDASHVMWVASANTVEGIPEPIRDRLVVLRAPMPDVEHLGSIVDSVYAEANAGRRDFFAPRIDPELRDQLVGISPRSIRLMIEDGMVRAAADGRRTIAKRDLVERRNEERQLIGFVRNLRREG